MAAALGFDVPHGGPSIDISMDPMTSHPITFPNDEVEISPRASSHSSDPSPPSLPLPNPHFVFPAAKSSSSTSTSPFPRTTARRPRSAAQAESSTSGSALAESKACRRASALPAFSFNPGAGLAPPDHPFLSPPQSPATPRTIPTRPSGAGHRRGGSEFVGGKLKDGEDVTLVSTSPTRSESGMASPGLVPFQPTPRRRGHAHRRSAAISSHDLSMILKPTGPNTASVRGNSAPSSPTEPSPISGEFFALGKKDSPKSERLEAESLESIETELAPPLPPPMVVQEKEPVRPVTRAKVGFSDTLEYIPRPLSLVSNDTSSTMTARPAGHSVTGSITSLISMSSATVPDTENYSQLSRSPSRTTNESRPSTAGAVLERMPSITVDDVPTSPRRRNSIPYLEAFPAPNPTAPVTPSPSKTPKRWSFFGLDPFMGTQSPTRAWSISSSSSDTPTKSRKLTDCPVVHSSEKPTDLNADALSPPRTPGKKNKRKKKVKSWAGSILTRKNKPRRKSRRAPTPPPPRALVEDGGSDHSTEMAPSPVMPTVLVTESESLPDETDSWQLSPNIRPTPEDDASVAMIDLDAALGPFNTPLPRNPEWEAAQKAGGLLKRQLHSAAGMSRFTGPGMHYSHRRAESAPEMPPFNRAGMPRWSSNSTMADVFEEDEEEDGASDRATSDMGDERGVGAADLRMTDTFEVPLPKVDEVMDDAATSSVRLSRRGSGLSSISDDDKTQRSTAPKSEYSASSLHEDVIIEETTVLDMQDTDSGCSVMATYMDPDHTHYPSPRRSFRGKDLAPVDISPLQLPTTQSLMPVSPYAMTTSSAYPSPRSQISYDGNRISTAPSSIVEDNFQSLLMGEPGPELRLSSDIPSLTSSNSTMTGGSAFIHFPQARPQPAFRGERPASFTGTAFGRRRSSLASLHRLISTSHGERSKLSTEVSFNEPDKKPKVSKTKRLSRMMQFWKTRENHST